MPGTDLILTGGFLSTVDTSRRSAEEPAVLNRARSRKAADATL